MSTRFWRWHWHCRDCRHQWITTGGYRPDPCPSCRCRVSEEQTRAELVEQSDDGELTVLHSKANHRGRL